MRLTRVLLSALSILIWFAIVDYGGPPAFAADQPPAPTAKPKLTTDRRTIALKAGSSKHTAGEQRSNEPETLNHSKYKYVTGDDYKRRARQFEASVRRLSEHNSKANMAQAQCIDSATRFTCTSNTLLTIDEFKIRGAGVANPVPAISPQEAAYVAVARLRLTAPRPMIGPPPSINEWKMAAVGYPMWLWAEGNLDPAPVSDSVEDISVSLNARLVKIVYDMGDGHKLTCTNVSRAWTRSVTPGTPSPACGYTYQKPSLPHGKYTITANAVWAVDWQVNGVTGTIPFYNSASTSVPVGELQVLVR